MPSGAAKGKPDAKKSRLTLSELASYDDICTDALVDNVFFWSTIRKNRSKYNSGRGFSEDTITKILFDLVICDEDVKLAEAALIKLSGFKKFLDRLKTPKEQDEFKRHLRKYINIWLPDCPWEVSTTNRYTVITHEAAVIARRVIKKGETISYLTGTLVELTREEEKDLDLTRRDFSIVTSSRSKKTSMFLGPARFANHDCKANARLTTTGSSGMSVVAMRIIRENEEITVTYGEDYFGIDNCECLCMSCEQSGIGGWTRSDDMVSIDQLTSSEGTPAPYSLRRMQQSYRDSRSPLTPDLETSRSRGRRRGSTDLNTPPRLLTPSKTRSVKRTLERVTSALARFSPELNEQDMNLDTHCAEDVPILDDLVNAPPLEVLPEAELKNEIETEEGVQQSQPECVKSKTAITERSIPLTPGPEEIELPIELSDTSLQNSNAGPDLSSISLPSIIPRSVSTNLEPQSMKRKIDEETYGDEYLQQNKRPRLNLKQVLYQSTATDGIPQLILTPKFDMLRQQSRTSTSPDSVFERVRLSQPGTPLSSQADIGGEENAIVKLEDVLEPSSEVHHGLIRELLEDADSELSEMGSDEEFDDRRQQIVKRKKGKAKLKAAEYERAVVPEPPEAPRIRYPGDYTDTDILIVEPYSRWVTCKTCQGRWVQANGYCTRRECPRCERHSKLYGYQWPTVYDHKVARVKDHRVVHRFLSAVEEEEVRQQQLCV